MILLLSALAFGEPADVAPACDFTLVDVVPAAGSVGVPIDTVLRVQSQGSKCDSSPVSLALAAEGDPAEIFALPTEDVQWHLFPDAGLVAETSYTAVFSHPEIEDLTVQFSTASGVAQPPGPPTLEILDLVATEQPLDSGGQYVMTAQVEATLSDGSGASTAAFSTLGVERVERSGADGVVPAVITWEQPDAVEGCVAVVEISGALERSDPVEACRSVDEVILASGGCSCSSGGGSGAAWLALLLAPALLGRRRG